MGVQGSLKGGQVTASERGLCAQRVHVVIKEMLKDERDNHAGDQVYTTELYEPFGILPGVAFYRL